MNGPEARVVAIDGHHATVSVEAVAACARCAAGHGCGAGLLQKGRTRLIQARLGDGLDLAPGDRVRLELTPDHLLRAAWLAYGLPLLVLVLAVAAAARISEAGEFVVVASGAVGLICGLLAGRLVLNRSGCLQHVMPRVSGKIVQDDGESHAPAAGPTVRE